MQLTRRINDPVGELFAEFDRLIRAPFGPSSGRANPMRGFDLYETEADWRLRADLPGLSKEDLEVTLKDGLLTIRADRDGDTHGLTGSLERTLRLPKDIATDEISASLENGVLELTLPKQKPATPETTRIEIN